MTAQATVELCTRTFNGGRCDGILYRPQPDLVLCPRCGGREPGVVYTRGQVLEDALVVLRLLDRWAELQEDLWTAAQERDQLQRLHQAGEALLAGLVAFRQQHPSALTGKE